MGFLDFMGFLKPETLKNKAKSYIKERYNRDIECDDICLSFKEVQLKNFRLSEEGGFENGIFLEAKNVFVKLDIIAALSKNIDIKALSFEDIYVKLIKLADGKFNFAGLLPQKTDKSPGKSSEENSNGWNVKAGDISLVRGILTFKDIKSGRVFCIKGINCSAQELSFLKE